MVQDAPGMKGYRSRNKDGELREKRGDTHIATIRKQYGDNVAPGMRGDTHLHTAKEKAGVTSLDGLLRKQEKKG
jgi:hypothetical protein